MTKYFVVKFWCSFEIELNYYSRYVFHWIQLFQSIVVASKKKKWLVLDTKDFFSSFSESDVPETEKVHQLLVQRYKYFYSNAI